MKLGGSKAALSPSSDPVRNAVAAAAARLKLSAASAIEAAENSQPAERIGLAKDDLRDHGRPKKGRRAFRQIPSERILVEKRGAGGCNGEEEFVRRKGQQHSRAGVLSSAPPPLKVRFPPSPGVHRPAYGAQESGHGTA